MAVAMIAAADKLQSLASDFSDNEDTSDSEDTDTEDTDEGKCKIHKNNLYSLVILRGNGETLKVSRLFVTEANQLYKNGKAAIWFKGMYGKAEPIRLAYEIVCNSKSTPNF